MTGMSYVLRSVMCVVVSEVISGTNLHKEFEVKLNLRNLFSSKALSGYIWDLVLTMQFQAHYNLHIK